MMVYQVAVSWDDQGNPTDFITLGYTVTQDQLDEWRPGTEITKSVTTEAWNKAGGLEVGDFEELDNPDADPLEEFYKRMREQAVLMPWLLDPEILALSAAAHLEGRSLREDELVQTEWWQTHSEGEREWLMLASSDPATALKLQEDNRIIALELMEKAGIDNAHELMVTVDGQEISLADYVADLSTRGTWTSTFLNRQITLLGNGDFEGIDPLLQAALSGTEIPLNTNVQRISRVRELYNTWLGPLLGEASDTEVQDWARKLRDNPDGEDELKEFLKDQRMAMLPMYGNREVSYAAAAGPWRNLMAAKWGMTPDETDPFFLELVKLNDAVEAEKRLRQTGLDRGIEQVRSDFLRDITSSFGDQVVRTA
jgi:hypothetical protein